MRKLLAALLILLASCSTTPARATTYYVNASGGSDSNVGTDLAHAFATPAKAATLTNPGDSVEILAGTYGPFWITRSGSAGNQITYEAYQGQSVTIQKTGYLWSAVELKSGASYITVNGLHLVGNAQSITYAQAIAAVDWNNTTNGDCFGMSSTSHHIIITNNEASWCPGGGIDIDGDYVTMYGNVIHNNAYWSPLATSGTTVLGHSIDTATTPKILVYNNVYYGNQNFICNKFQTSPCRITDGEGIIVDTNKNTYTSGRVQLYNNIIYNNGAPGIVVFQARATDVFNNTLYVNNKSANETDPNYIAFTTTGGEIAVSQSTDIKVENNILYGNSSVAMFYQAASGNVSLTWDYNLYFAGLNATADTAHAIVADPRFVSPQTFDFHLQSCLSPAREVGNPGLASLTDFSGTSRGSLPSMGAYQ